MAELKAKSRNALSDRVFGLPSQRKYPIPDKEHAVLAKGRATEMLHKGKLTKEQAAKIKAKANAKLGK